ncbi:hypothetical protein H4R18_005254 [Coemansia javaensis]|uniref:Uncharacterized protein n=1 Tax=Coemansia javaensis TaxID=2761396 RepID=A0A9W8H232_9FUNG|nr:hypothetical protein H4R18_005254 [Coemansia javaensis]
MANVTSAIVQAAEQQGGLGFDSSEDGIAHEDTAERHTLSGVDFDAWMSQHAVLEAEQPDGSVYEEEAEAEAEGDEDGAVSADILSAWASAQKAWSDAQCLPEVDVDDAVEVVETNSGTASAAEPPSGYCRPPLPPQDTPPSLASLHSTICGHLDRLVAMADELFSAHSADGEDAQADQDAEHAIADMVEGDMLESLGLAKEALDRYTQACAEWSTTQGQLEARVRELEGENQGLRARCAGLELDAKTAAAQLQDERRAHDSTREELAQERRGSAALRKRLHGALSPQAEKRRRLVCDADLCGAVVSAGEHARLRRQYSGPQRENATPPPGSPRARSPWSSVRRPVTPRVGLPPGRPAVSSPGHHHKLRPYY